MTRARPRGPRLTLLLLALAAARAEARAAAAETGAAPGAGTASALPSPPPIAPPEASADGEPAEAEVQGFELPAGTSAAPPLSLNGYVDFGFANAAGDGTSFAPGDNRVPADYGVDTFATAVNTRGDVASIDARGRVTNGFLPRSVNIGGRPSFLINVVNQDLRYQAQHVPVMAFVRVQLLPRWGGDGAGNVTPLY